MKLKIIDFIRRLELDAECRSWLESGSFSMRPIYHRQSNVLQLQIELDQVLPYVIYHRFLARLHTYAKVKVDLRIEVKDHALSLMDLLDYIQHFVQREASARIFAEVMPLIHEDVILYQVPETSQRDALAARLPLLKAFLVTVGIINEIRIELKDKEEQIPAVKCANAPVRQTPPPAASNPPANPYRRRKVSTKDYVSVDIRDLQDGMSNVKIRGHIFQSEITTFKNGKCLQTLYISDDDDAIIMKRFERGALTKEALAEIKEGDHVEAYGQAVMDSYLSDLVFMPTHIEKVEPTVRRDPAKEKRIELHVHSNFSEMDGVCDIAQFIQTADEWGMDAIACTDHMVVQAFPKAQSTLASINKKRETPMKVLYGVEMNMVDPDLQIVYQPDDTVLEEGTYCVLAL